MARRWIAIGAAIVVFASLFAFAVFVFDMPVHNGDTGRLATKAETASGLLMIGGVGSIFVVLGVLIRRSR
ncbi:MAG: hypothetical protein EBR34_12305 [Sphingomonadaceae bacterium]|nr:hypothetical protein [Sphingomonadaceae bacterium]